MSIYYIVKGLIKHREKRLKHVGKRIHDCESLNSNNKNKKNKIKSSLKKVLVGTEVIWNNQKGHADNHRKKPKPSTFSSSLII